MLMQDAGVSQANARACSSQVYARACKQKLYARV